MVKILIRKESERNGEGPIDLMSWLYYTYLVGVGKGTYVVAFFVCLLLLFWYSFFFVFLGCCFFLFFFCGFFGWVFFRVFFFFLGGGLVCVFYVVGVFLGFFVLGQGVVWDVFVFCFYLYFCLDLYPCFFNDFFNVICFI